MSKKLIVITGPSGVGNSDVIAALFARRADLSPVVPVTARKMKESERDGVGFYFFDLEGWNAMKEAGELLETTEFAGNDYGTSRRLVREKLDAGLNVLLECEPRRAAQIKANMPEALCIYLEPSPELLAQRLKAISRSELECSLRLRTAERLRCSSGFCDCRICSDDPNSAVAAIEGLID